MSATRETGATAPAGPATTEGRTIYRRPLLLSNPTSYCPGCGHGIVHRLVAEVLEEMDLGERTILVGSVGCSVFAYDYLRLDSVESPHGRAAAVATGVKRVRPDRVVFTYQGDGDLAAIGTAEIVHAAARGERFTTIFVNNGIYGMTGGQMAPTTLPGQKTTSSPLGRDVETQGYPLPVTEILSLLAGVQYAARVSVADPGHVGQGEAGDQARVRGPARGQGLLDRRGAVDLPRGLGHDPDGGDGPPARHRDGRVPRRHLRGPPPPHRAEPAAARAVAPLDHGGLLMELSTIIAGFGGQGILFAGKVLAEAALLEGREVLWIPSYGPEMRGGTASCTVIVADRPIGSPIVDRADHAVVLNPPSMAKYTPFVAVGGLLVVNTTLIEAEPGRDDIEVLEVPCTAVARKAGDDKLVSVVALGALVGARRFVEPESVHRALSILLGARHADMVAADIAAFDAGYEAGLEEVIA